MLLISHMTSSNHVKKELYDFTLSHHSAKFVGTRSYGGGDRTILICHVPSSGHRINCKMTLYLEAPNPK